MDLSKQEYFAAVQPLESADTEEVIDAFLCCEVARRARPGMVPTFRGARFLALFSCLLPLSSHTAPPASSPFCSFSSIYFSSLLLKLHFT